MNTFLLFISFLLNGLTVYAVIVLYTRQNRLAEVEKRQEKMINEMEEMISSYLFEMKEENEDFLNKFNRLNNEIPLPSFEKRISEDTLITTAEQKIIEIKPQPINTSNTIRLQAAKAYQTNLVNKPAEITPPEENSLPVSDAEFLIDQVKSLAKQGLTDEEIAKKLKRGKTEIELLLKFHQNTQE